MITILHYARHRFWDYLSRRLYDIRMKMESLQDYLDLKAGEYMEQDY